MASVSVEEVRQHCQKILEPLVDLPEGYELLEDVDFVYLVYGDKVLATFSSLGVHFTEISWIAQKHFQERQ